MSTEQKERRLREVKSKANRAKQIASVTVPGKSNDNYVETARDLPEVLEEVEDSLNNWFEVIEVTIHDGGIIGISMRYRWSVERWAANDMDSWLEQTGWDHVAHRNADTHERERHEIEARYMKEYMGYDVRANFLVPFTNRALDRLMSNRGVDKARRKMERDEKMKDLKEAKRGGN